ncbi:hypothetical protein [Pseudobacteriovorax antillogorgiicola]|uniref:Vitellogenin domain-containing protein n=1 Tax=Pseudobacteriovorax antillogorgiicola TaxID=1513793 RepID=A0A1Y6B9D3_9BACT|nr:hypothetical protein [Pseudobacteriovorax antillogorgiicola]TCS57557.1 hypothetical protein EDD56_103297 [Pseudobacteriovorax antillogorgiicola]SME99786.1 hypothetical protein SAMN06296036_10336 [Pseudobacteriovorax antillogorgiicola]
MRDATKYIAYTIPIVILVAIGFLVLEFPPKNNEIQPKPKGQLICNFSKGDRSAFRFESKVAANNSQVKPSAEDFLRMTISLDVIENHKTYADLHLRFGDLELKQDLTHPEERILGNFNEGIVMRIGSDCRIHKLGFPKEWQASTRQFLASQLKTLEFVLPADQTTKIWNVRQKDSVGYYLAQYEARPLEQKYKIIRIGKNYETQDMQHYFGVSFRVLDSQGEAILDPGGTWWAQVTGTMSMVLHTAEQEKIDLLMTYQLARNPDLYKIASNTVLAVNDFDFREPNSLDQKEKEGPVSGLEKITFSEIREKFSGLLKGDEKDYINSAEHLADWLRTNPKETSKILQALRRQEFSEDEKPAVFLALELAGTTESKQVLIAVVEDSQFKELDRAQAISALADHGEPSLEVTQLVMNYATDSSSRMLSVVSLLAVGSIGDRSRAQHQEVAQTVQTYLKSRLDDAQGVSEEVNVLDAIGNSGDNKFDNDLRKRLDHKQPSIRASAALAYRNMEPVVGETVIVKSLNQEPHPDVRLSMVEALHTLKVKSPKALAAGAKSLEKETSKKVKTQLVNWLGSAKSETVAKNALVEAFHRETNTDIKQHIGRYLSAKDLLRK